MVTKPASGNASTSFAKLAEAYETLALFHSRVSGTPMPPKKSVIKRDPNEPKRPHSAYLLFMHDKRLEIKDSQPDIMPADVMTKTVEAWNNISDKERKHYEERAVLMKKAYAEEMAKYKAEHGTPAVESEEDDSPVVPAPTKAPRAKKAKEPVVEAAVVEEEPKKAEAVTNGAPEKRKKKSASAGGVAENAGDRDSEKKKKKKKSHKSKHSESQ